jgi:transposase
MALGGNRRNRGGGGLDAWPGYVDALSTLLMVIIFVLLVFVLAQGFLSVALSSRDRALDRLNSQVAELAEMLALERGQATELRSALARTTDELRAAASARDLLTTQLRETREARDRLGGERDAAQAELAGLREQIAALVQQSGTSLTGIYGVGVFVAARILAEVVDVRRYPSRHTFAAANGSAPIPASSGRTVRHRLNRGGNRQLNRALYTIAITEIRADTEGRAYYERTRAEGKTSREALRCLKRRLSDVVYRTLRADQAATDPLPLAAAA